MIVCLTSVRRSVPRFPRPTAQLLSPSLSDVTSTRWSAALRRRRFFCHARARHGRRGRRTMVGRPRRGQGHRQGDQHGGPWPVMIPYYRRPQAIAVEYLVEEGQKVTTEKVVYILPCLGWARVPLITAPRPREAARCTSSWQRSTSGRIGSTT